MKKQLIWTTLLASGFLAACSQNDDSTPSANEGQPVSFVVNTSVARTTTDLSTGLTNFIVNTDVIGIYSNNVDPKLDDTFTVKAEGALTSVSNTTYYFDGTSQSADFYAFYPSTAAAYPSTEGTTQTGRTFMVASDQSTLEKMDATDFMTAKQTASPTNTTVKFNFGHRSTLVKITMRNITNVQSVELGNIAPTITWTYADDQVATSGTPTSIAMYAHTAADNSMIYYAIVPAQTVTAGTALVTIATTDGKTYKYTPASDVTFNENTQKTFSLGISNNILVELSTALEAQWGEQDGNAESGTVEEIQEEPKVYVTEPTTLTQLTTGRADLKTNTESPWGYYLDSSYSGATLSCNEDTKAFTLQTASNGNWAKSAIYYYGGTTTINTGKKYKLTLTVTSDTASKQLGVGLSPAAASGTKFFCIEDGTTTKTYYGLRGINCASVNTEISASVTFNCAYTCTQGNTSKVLPYADPEETNVTSKTGYVISDTSEESEYYIIIYPVHADATFTVQNIQMEEVVA